MAIHAWAVPQVEPPSVGNHLVWIGPHTWGYSLRGWDIQRLEWRPGEEITCDRLEAAELADLRANHERALRFGALRCRSGVWPASIVPGSPTPPASAPCEVYTLEFDTPQSYAAVRSTAADTFAIALCSGKALAARSAAGPALATLEFRAIAIDTVVVYVIAPLELSFCIAMPIGDEELRWQGSKSIVRGLQLPVRELVPALADADGEYAEANARLLAGESLGREEFERIAGILRASVPHAAPPRPIDQVLLLREGVNEAFEELKALDPIHSLLPHPKWRRVLGFGWFDNDPALVAGETYQYPITGYFPDRDLADTVYGFHTVPSAEWLPASFFLGPIRLRLSEPTPVVLVPPHPPPERRRSRAAAFGFPPATC